MLGGRAAKGFWSLVVDSKAVVLNLSVTTPFTVAYQISCISNIYIITHKSSKISYDVVTKITFMVGAQHNMRTGIKGQSMRKVENHCSKWIKKTRKKPKDKF